MYVFLFSSNLLTYKKEKNIIKIKLKESFLYLSFSLSWEFHFLFSKAVNSNSWLPFITLNTNVPIVTQTICDQIAHWWNFSTTNWGLSESQWLYFISDTVVPKVHNSFTSTCHKPNIANWWKWHCINRIKNYIAGIFLNFMRFESNDSFLKIRLKIYESILSGCWLYDIRNIGSSIKSSQAYSISSFIDSYRLK